MEQEFIRWLRARNAESNQLDVLVAIGDDAAVFDSGNRPIVVTCDAVADGTHFDLNVHSLRQVGRKAIAVNLSDIAAMGAQPRYATLCFFLPKDFTFEQAKELFTGAAEFANSFGVSVIGGDTNSWDGKLVVNVNSIGQVNGEVWQMSTAQIGDVIVVTGEYGGSILAHHIDFEPRCRLAAHFAQHYQVHAATDVTDSLSSDLNQICLLSQCGAEIELDKIPVRLAAHELSRLQKLRTPLEHALYDGEDFELILAVSGSEASRMLQDESYGNELTVIGRFVEGQGVVRKNDDGSTSPLLIKGYSH